MLRVCMGSVFLLGHLGLGDMLICNGMVRRAARGGRQVVVVCKARSCTAAKHMYRDLANVHLLPVEDDCCISPRFGGDGRVLQAMAQAGYEVVLLGLHRGHLAPGSGFADAFYDQVGIPRDVRYTEFHVDRPPSSAMLELPAAAGGAYVFVHDDADRGFIIQDDRLPKLPIVRPGKADGRPGSDNVFNYWRLMEGAHEYHGIDSVFSHMADLLDLLPGSRFLHCTAKNPADECERLFLRPGWQFVR